MKALERKLTEKERHIRSLEREVVRSKLLNELNRRGVLSADLVADYLEGFVKLEGDRVVVLDEKGNPRLKAVRDAAGRFQMTEMGVEDLIDEFLEANPHLLPQEGSEEENEEDAALEEQYRRALEESRKRGWPTSEMLKLMVKKYGKTS
jgi:hypothetical protein